MERALAAVFGINGSLADINFAGRTDRWIMRQVCWAAALQGPSVIFHRRRVSIALTLPP
jgi:hypothetical protein